MTENMPNDLGFGEVELSGTRRLVVMAGPGLLGPLITISLQQLSGRQYDTEAQIVVPAQAAQYMADIITAFVRGEKREE
jgi:hypothetical protein